MCLMVLKYHNHPESFAFITNENGITVSELNANFTAILVHLKAYYR